MKKIMLIAVIIGVVFLMFFLQSTDDNAIIINIIQPIQHRSMDEIVAGFSEVMEQNMHKRYIIRVENAQGDINLQRSILQKLHDNKPRLIVPIGGTATQMAMATLPNVPILGLATALSEQDRHPYQRTCHMATVHDEVTHETTFSFFQYALPQIKKIALVYSPSDRIVPAVAKAIAVAKEHGIEIFPVMAASLGELMITLNSAAKDAQALFVLKDLVIVSGMGTLAKFGEQRGIPVIASDEGSVMDGATFALTVKEKTIGKEGAWLAIHILQEGRDPCSFPIVDMTQLQVFVNKKQALTKKDLDIDLLKRVAHESHYHVIMD